MNLSGRVALVTGAGQGIGRAISLRLAEAGASVVVNDISERAEETAELIRQNKGQAAAILADVSSSEDVAKLAEKAIATFGKIDILVNNAGITRDQLLMRMSDDDWQKVLRIDLDSVFLCTRAVMRPMMKQRWGRIINLASVVGLTGNAGQANYAAAKAGVIGFTRSIAKEVGSRNITVNAIAPGYIDTDMTRKLPEEQRAGLLKGIPLGRPGTPQDVAEAVAFLAAEETGYITGQVLSVDGGMAMH